MRGLLCQIERVICYILELGRLLAFYTTVIICSSRLEGIEEVISVEINV